MAKKPTDPALVPPRMTILSDHPILREDEKDQDGREHDSFMLHSRLGAVYDIIRHKNTRAPLAIAVYGDWGTGKSSAMRWLSDELGKWSKLSKTKREGHYRARTVWFDPWKYTKREDVCRESLERRAFEDRPRHVHNGLQRQERTLVMGFPDYKRDLLAEDFDANYVLDRYFHTGQSDVFSGAPPDEEANFKYDVATKFFAAFGIRVHPFQLIITGSAHLGFSPVPGKLGNRFNAESSDIDIALVSPELFDAWWTELQSGSLDTAVRETVSKDLFWGSSTPQTSAMSRAADRDGGSCLAACARTEPLAFAGAFIVRFGPCRVILN